MSDLWFNLEQLIHFNKDWARKEAGRLHEEASKLCQEIECIEDDTQRQQFLARSTFGSADRVLRFTSVLNDALLEEEKVRKEALTCIRLNPTSVIEELIMVRQQAANMRKEANDCCSCLSAIRKTIDENLECAKWATEEREKVAHKREQAVQTYIKLARQVYEDEDNAYLYRVYKELAQRHDETVQVHEKLIQTYEKLDHAYEKEITAFNQVVQNEKFRYSLNEKAILIYEKVACAYEGTAKMYESIYDWNRITNILAIMHSSFSKQSQIVLIKETRIAPWDHFMILGLVLQYMK
jgi:tetratricopeptide (TPR) repeat protein